MADKPSKNEASEAAKEAHSDDPETRKEAMATLRDRRGSSAKEPSKSDKKTDK